MSSPSIETRERSTMFSPSIEMSERLDYIQKKFDDELKEDIDSNVCVFQVPKSLSSAKPEAYTPQLVGLGPYHHLLPQLMEMERVKLDIVKKLHKEFHGSSFANLVTRLSVLDPHVCSCYHKFFYIEKDKLSWIMAVDALFLFNLICQHGVNKETLKLSDHLGALADNAGKKLAKDAMLRDVLMLENQIPIFFMKNMLAVVCVLLQVAEKKTIVTENFPHMLFGFCQALSPLSPLKEKIDYSLAKVLKRAHLLDLLYSMVVPREDEFEISNPADIINIEEEHKIEVAPQSRSSLVENIETAYTIVKNSNVIAQKLKALADLYSSGNEEASPEEKALIPTASSLAKAGVKFSKTQFIKDISFDEITHTFQLPAIKLGVNSEVVIRNLVAFEAMAISGHLVFAHFVELMDALIDTPDDVKILKKQKIITGHLKDDEVMHLFNGMSKKVLVFVCKTNT